MKEFNKNKIFELQEKVSNKKQNEPIKQKIFGVEISINDENSNGIVEDNNSSVLPFDKAAIFLDNLDLGFGD